MSGDDKIKAGIGWVLEHEKLTAWIGELIEKFVYAPIVRPILRIGVIDSLLRPDGHPLVAGLYKTEHAVVHAIDELHAAGHGRLIVYSPAPSHEIEEAMAAGPSIVRFFAFVGAILGGTGGFALAALTSLDRGLVVAGKPIVSIPPFLVISFESTILIGALATLLGFFISTRLPQPELDEVFDGRFSDDCYGIGIVCREDDLAQAEAALAKSGAEEVWRAE